MTNGKYFFAVDLGATSGRTILGKIESGKIETEELSRFGNFIVQTGGHCYWDIFNLYNEIIKGLKIVAKRNIEITSVGIDTWGVDIAFIGKDGNILRSPLSYRDPFTFEAFDDYLKNVMDRKTLYGKSGIQLMNFNTLFQLHACRKENNSALECADKILFLPDALSYMLTGETVCEYTIASTSQMLDPYKKELDEELLASVGVSRDKFGKMVMPGDKIGVLSEEVQKITGLGAIPVIAVAGHDTGSAVAAIPAEDGDFAYLSSGTWSLMGIESNTPVIDDNSYENNFTNEGGVEGTVRFLKNICGMWLLEQCRKEWGESAPQSHPELIAAALKVEQFRSVINPDDARFANPPSMVQAIKDFCKETNQPVPETYGEICRCIYESLALRYKGVFQKLKEASDHPLNTLNVIGGGSLNEYLNQITADACGVKVVAGPQECTALGNILMQAKAANIVERLSDSRKIIANSVNTKSYNPVESEVWEEAYNKIKYIYQDR